ncbi:MAG: AI-2E family transporter [Planctomycetes bacterium]|nr:AI-2E family transporter [Planctomycetota bacterium]
MSEETPRYDFDRVFRLLLTVGTLIATFWLLAYLSDVLVPFAVAVLLAYLLNPIVNAFEQKTGGRRGLAVGLTLTIFAVAFLVLVPLLGSVIYVEVADISDVFADKEIKAKIVERIKPLLEKLPLEDAERKLREFMEGSDPEQVKKLAIDAAAIALPELLKFSAAAMGVLGTLLNAVLALTGVVIVLLYLIFLLMDFNSFQSGWKEQLPPQYREAIVEFFGEFSRAMSRYFRGQFLVAACCGVLFAIGFKIVGIRLAVFVGLFVGLLNMVPYLQTVGFGPAILLALLKAFESEMSPLWPILGIVIVFAVVQLIQDAVLTPQIMGQATGLKPWVMLLSIFIWAKLLGFLGLVLAIPLSCLGLAYYRRSILKVSRERGAD